MNRFSITLAAATVSALALIVGAPVGAHAAYYDPDGEWMDTRHHLALNSMPANSEAIAHLNYAKITCRTKTGTTDGGPATPGYIPCMKAQGYVFVYATPAQIAAREKAAQDGRNTRTDGRTGAHWHRQRPQPPSTAAATLQRLHLPRRRRQYEL
jgi:hypothetical protein